MITEVNNRKYIDLFRGSFKAFGYFADELIFSANSYDFFKTLSENIVPLISKAKAFESFYLQWIKDKGDFKKEYELTEKAVIQEINDTFSELRLIVDSENLMENPQINEAVFSIENVLKFKEGHQFVMPPYYEVAYDRLCELCYRLLKLNRADLVKDFAEICYINNSSVDPETQEIVSVKEPHVSSFKFVPARSRLADLKKVFSWDNLDNDWAIWEHLYLAHWCWVTPASYFEEKKLEYQDINACAESSNILNMHAFWVEMYNIKNKKDLQKQAIFFDKKRFIRYFKVILNKIFFFQEIHGVEENKNIQQEITPYSIELKLNGHQLVLGVEWFKEAEIETFAIHKFNEESTPHQFTKDLFKENLGTKVFIDHSNWSIPKYFERTKLKGLLEQIFFNKIDTYSTSIRGFKIFLKDRPEIDLSSLCSYIKNLNRVDNSWFHTQINYSKGK